MATDASMKSNAMRKLGNDHYKAFKFEQAIHSYTFAADLAPDDPLPFSNLAAVHFEIGDYHAAIASSDRALTLTDDEDKKQKLYIRKAKAQIHLKQHEQALKTVELLYKSKKKAGLHKCIEICLQSQRAATTGPANPAQMAMGLPRYKPQIRPVLEYYPYGHDYPMSLIDESLVKAAGNCISVMFGGIGDMRHLLATMIKIEQLEESGSIPEKRYSFTLVDCHPTTIARDFLFFLFFQDLADSEDYTDTKHRNRRSEIMSCMFYTYMAPIMPENEYRTLEEKLREAISILKGQGDFPTFLDLPKTVHSQVLQVFDEWLHKVQDEYPASRVRPHVVQSRQVLMWENERLHPGSASRCCLVPELEKQELFYRTTGILVNSLDRNEMLKELRRSYQRFDPSKPQNLDRKFLAEVDKIWKTNPTLFDLKWHHDFNPGLQVPSLDFNPFEIALPLLADRFVNYDPKSFEKYGLRLLMMEFFWMVGQAIRRLESRLRIDICLDDVVSVLERCHNQRPAQGRPDHDSATESISLVSLTLDDGSAATQPQACSLYDRIHLSNVTDYITNLSTFMYALPAIRQGPDFYVTSNCLKDCSNFKTFAHYHNEHVALHSASDLKKVFGVRLGDYNKDVRPDVVAQYARWHRDLPSQKLSELMERQQLETWLFRLFFKIAIPVVRDPSDGSVLYSPLNLTAFVRVCRNLFETGYPAHWISGILDEICSGTVKTSARPPRSVPLDLKESTEEMPVLSQSTRPFVAEMTTLLSIWQTVLPFGVLSLHIPSMSDIRTYTCHFSDAMDIFPYRPGLVLVLFSLLPHQVPPVSRPLLLSDETGDRSRKAEVKRNLVHVVSTWEWDMQSHTATFSLRKDVVEVMRKFRNSLICIWRADSWSFQTEPEPLEKLREVGPFLE